MVYYFTSSNVKTIRNILIDYEQTSDLTPHEYMKSFIENCSESIEDAKISWIVETFLGVQKYNEFLKDIASLLPEDLFQKDKEYFTIICYAIIFQVSPTDHHHLYKCLFHLSKNLLNTFSNFLCTEDVLNNISQVAESYYDTNFITDKIINPISSWQPYISEMAFNYADYKKKINGRKIKLPTVPVQPNVLNRKSKETGLPSILSPIPNTPPNSVCHKNKKMLTKSAIDQKLQFIQSKNKQKAAELLNTVKSQDHHYTQGKSDKYYKTLNDIKNEMRIPGKKYFPKSKPKATASQLEVKETAATLRRMNKRIQITEQQETKWLQDLVENCNNTTRIEELEEYDRQEKERQRLIDIEKKHLLGQISYEEAVIAKKKVKELNRKKYEDFLREKRIWECEIENWKKILQERNRKAVENLSMLELNVLQSKNNIVLKKKEIAENVKKESEQIIAQAIKEKHEELERRINMIKQIKILSIIAKKAKLPKIIDLTESSGLGLLCEMSMAELQERLSAMKIGLKVNWRKKRIKYEKTMLLQSKNLLILKKLSKTSWKNGQLLVNRIKKQL